MRRYLTFFLALAFLLSLAASCQRKGSQDPPKSQTSGEASKTHGSETETPVMSTTSATLPDDCDSPPGGLEDVNPGDLPPGFALDPEEPDKYLYVKEWHG